MAEEERFVRLKRAPKHAPVHAALYCLKQANIEMQDVNVIATSWDSSLDERDEMGEVLRSFAKHEVLRDVALPPLEAINHHLAHAAASYYASGFDDAAILVMDGQGENVSTTIAHGKGRDIRIIREFDVSQSLGYFYSAVTRYVGLGSNGSGKTMGLASYGEPKYDFPMIAPTPDGYHLDIIPPRDIPPSHWHAPIRDQWMTWFSKLFGPPNLATFYLDDIRGTVRRSIALDARFKDVAASAQKALEQIILHLVDVATAATGCRRVVLAGGVALNCSVNGALRHSGKVDDLYVFPAAHDAGGALGAALVGRLVWILPLVERGQPPPQWSTGVRPAPC